MFSHALKHSLNLDLLIILSIVSILICVGQIIFRKKFNILAICKVTIFLPLVITLILRLSDLSNAFWTTAHANEISGPFWNMGLCRFFASIASALYITIMLSGIYELTVCIFVNRKET
jgi:hypothetical protein